MKAAPRTIQQFELSPLATRGVLVRAIEDPAERQPEHPVAMPHRDAHYLLLLATAGTFTLSLDFEAFPGTGPALAVVFPGQVHEFRAQPGLRGWMLSFDPTLLEADLQQALEEGLRGPRQLERDSAFYAQATALLALLTSVQQTEAANAHAARAVQALLAALLSLLAGLVQPAEPARPGRQPRGPWLARAFRQLLRQHYQHWKQPARYAAELAVSVAHLNDTVKEQTGVSVSGHIQQQSILEAKRLLCFTDSSIKEVGYAAGYEEPVYFSRLFRKVAGCTPLAFRQKFRE
ncbi:helix-turn-helix domain-containing protein [Hymenobacter sp. APR13]|uniref:helix-turn-helix domain-containing protein n=1 Tax=Hymenobacter sp. APR13 TaxID=1356852 RepID=UPI0004E03FA1|nr:AraC family transcriptional regulator [Hymenobacter sp. APR13]AII50679.1 hypothetical protein N008_01600 [Hymenobacter sp. APR13]